MTEIKGNGALPPILWTPTQHDFDRFAAISGDDNPIHVDPVFSAHTRFGRTVSHGMLIYSRVWAELAHRFPGKRHRAQAMMFPNPAYAEEALQIEIVPDRAEPALLSIRVVRIDDHEPVFVGACRLDDMEAA